MIKKGSRTLFGDNEVTRQFEPAAPLPTIDIENRRYIGSKAKLLDWIFEHIKEECEGDSFADIFAGTGVVSARAARLYKKIILNDLLHSNYAAYQGFFAQEPYDRQKVLDLVCYYNSLTPNDTVESFFSNNFGGKYFTPLSAKLIGHIRNDLERRRAGLNNKEYFILLTSLLYSA